VANLPATIPQVPKRADQIRQLLGRGWTPHEIAEQLAGEDQRKRNVVLTQIRKLAFEPAVQEEVAMVSKGTLMIHMPEVVAAVVRRAVKGNIPAAKLAMEASGFHNPRMDHHHSGKIEIELKGVPRPERVVDEDNVVDADVVDE
jgi:hypothetical protein